jgi:hypothetical protein
MLAHYLRRILGGLLTIWLGSFLFYNVFVHMPELPSYGSRYPEEGLYFYALAEHYELEQPWPLDYARWLFDPTEPDKPYTFIFARQVIEYVPPYVDLQIGPHRLRGSGLLTGDLGMSRGVPVLNLAVQSDTLRLPAILFGSTTLLMVASIIQRKGRKPVFGAASAPLAAVARIEATYRYTRAAT